MDRIGSGGQDGDTPRILFVISGLEVGGTERQVASLVSESVRAGFRVTVYSLTGGEMREQFERAGAELIVGTYALNARGLSFKRSGLVAFLAMRLLGIMLTRRPTIVHFFLPAAYLVGAPLAVLCRIPIRVMSRRSLNNYQRSRFLRAVEHRLHRMMHAVVGNSRSVIEQLKREGVPPDRLTLIYNGVDAAAFSSVGDGSAQRARLGLPQKSLVMCIVANLIGYKGHRDLIDALAMSASALPSPWRLLVVGRDDGIGLQLRKQVKSLGLEKNIDFLGLRMDIPEIFAASEIALLCSHEEGFANAILEGMAAGLPMIVTNVGGNAEAVIDRETGLVVPAHDPISLGQAIVTLANSPALRLKYGLAGQRRVVDAFSNSVCFSQYRALYGALLCCRCPADIGRLAMRK